MILENFVHCKNISKLRNSMSLQGAENLLMLLSLIGGTAATPVLSECVDVDQLSAD